MLRRRNRLWPQMRRRPAWFPGGGATRLHSNSTGNIYMEPHMNRIRLEEHVNRELDALRERVPQLSENELSALLALVRAVVPEGEKYAREVAALQCH
jgi:hypothetical protein